MKRLLCIIIAAGLMLSSLGVLHGNGKRSIKIGSVHPLTGNMAYEGQAIVNAQQIAVDEINEMGGINGKRLELVTMDSMGEPDVAASCAVRLMDRGAVALTGTYTTRTAETVAREAEKAGVPFVVTVASGSDLLDRGYRSVFRVQPTAEDFAEDFINYISVIADGDMKTVGFIYEDSNYGQGIVESIKKNIDKTGLSVAVSISYPASAVSLSSEVSRLMAVEPDILVPVGYYSDQALLIGELLSRGAEFDAVVGVANGAISDYKITELYGSRIDGYFDINYRIDPTGTVALRLVEEYEKNYGKMPACAVYGYVSVIVIADALSRCGGDYDGLADYIRTANITSHPLPQEVISFGEDGEGIESGSVLIQIIDGEQKIVWPEKYKESDIVKGKKG